MLSDEEKEAIDDFKLQIEEDKKELPYSEETLKYKQTIKNLIEKQSKEIEELKITNKELTERVLRLESDKFWNNVVSKDKIKAKIEEIKEEVKTCSIYKKTGRCTNNCKEDCEYYDFIDILQSLLEDNKEDNTEEIEETNLHYVTCEYDFKNMHIVKLLNEFFEENNLIVNKLVRAVNKIGRNKK